MNRTTAAKTLSRWCSQGWLRRIGQGLYVPVPLDLAGTEQVVEDPWVLVPTLFGHCYVGGWTAAHHWDLTEQLFRELVSFMLEDPRTITRAIRLTFIGTYYERIADHATNVGELVVYMVEGKIIRHQNVD